MRTITKVAFFSLLLLLNIYGSQVSISFLTLKDYIGFAYRTRLNQIVGPDWLGSDRFNIVGKLADGASTDKVPEMMQSLLLDRFQMQMHREKKEFPVFAL